jgi:uncharacterized protein (TIGR03382 family)
VASIYTCTDEYIQPYSTSIIPGAKNIGLCNGFVGHYQFFYDPEIYLVMHAELTAPVAADPTQPADPADPDAPEADDTIDDGGGCSTGGTSAGGMGALVLAALALSTRRRR